MMTNANASGTARGVLPVIFILRGLERTAAHILLRRAIGKAGKENNWKNKRRRRKARVRKTPGTKGHMDSHRPDKQSG
jgi:hypothetical protein